MKTKVTYIVSNIDKAIAFEWIAEEIDKSKFELSFIFLNKTESKIKKILESQSIKCSEIPYFSKRDIPISILRVLKLLRKYKPDVIHCHLLEASLIGLFSGFIFRVRKRIYTRHHSTFVHEYFPKKVYIDQINNILATDIVAISNNVKDVLIQKENVSPNKITLIHHGFKLEDFINYSEKKVNHLKQKYHLNNQKPVIGVISRYIEWKGIEYIIEAFSKILEKYPNAMLILANANGSYKENIQNKLKKIPNKNYLEIKFEEDLFSLYQLFDYYVHTPIDKNLEAFGQTYVESLASGIPSVFTLSGIAVEFIEHKKNSIVVDYKNSDEIYNALFLLMLDNDLKNSIIKKGRKDVLHLFSIDKMIAKLEELYQ